MQVPYESIDAGAGPAHGRCCEDARALAAHIAAHAGWTVRGITELYDGRRAVVAIDPRGDERFIHSAADFGALAHLEPAPSAKRARPRRARAGAGQQALF